MEATLVTPDEKKAQRDARNAAICTHYKSIAGDPRRLRKTASRFQLGRQTVLNVLKDAGVFEPYVRPKRTLFLGVSVQPETKLAVQAEADRRGTSASEVADEAIRRGLEEAAK